jgi:hypothetical protein
MSRNSFKELEKLEIEKINAPIEQIKSNINHNLGTYHFAGDIIQLFIPKIFQLFLSFLTPENRRGTDPKSKYPNLRG